MLLYLVVPLISARVPLISTRVSAHCQAILLALPFLRCLIFKVWPWKSKVKVTNRYNTLSSHIPFVPCQSALPFLGYSYFKIWNWNFKVKVISEVKVESHNICPTFSQLTPLSFHVNRASNSWVMTFSKFDLGTQGSRSWVRSKFKVTMWV